MKHSPFIALALLNIAAAMLVFSIQPMSSKWLLPQFGGASMVWNTALMFFQGMLFLAYLYVFLLNRYLAPIRQAWVHCFILAAAVLSLPAMTGHAAPAQSPGLALLMLLLQGIGLPYFALAATSPLTQLWYAAYYTNNPTAAYYLYSFSNAGSLLALLLYPFLVEPYASITTQFQWWEWSFIGFALLLALFGFSGRMALAVTSQSAGEPPARATRFRWLAYSFVPSLYLMAVSLHLSIDIAATPLLWITPLSIYLLTFIIAFARPGLAQSYWLREALVLVLILLAIYFVYANQVFLFILRLAGLLLVGLVGHARLVASKPGPQRIPEFYVWLALGGWLGGISQSTLSLRVSTLLQWEVGARQQHRLL